MDAWRKVRKETIINCFSKCGFSEATLELFIDDDADAELSNFSQHGLYTFNELEGGHEGKSNSFRD